MSELPKNGNALMGKESSRKPWKAGRLPRPSHLSAWMNRREKRRRQAGRGKKETEEKEGCMALNPQQLLLMEFETHPGTSELRGEPGPTWG